MPGRPTASIVIVSFNCAELLARCLTSLRAAAGAVDVETIVVDNASGDGTPDMVRERFSGVRLIASPDNLGFGAGNNAGLALATGRVLVLLNPDTEAAPGSVETLVRALDEDGTIGLVGPRLVNADGSLQPSCRAFPTFGVAFLVLLKLYRVLRFLPAIRRYDCRGMDYGRSRDVDQVMGACMAIPRAVLDRVGAFDPRFWMWFDEVDLCLRVRQAGWRVRYCADAWVMHRLNQSTVLLSSVVRQKMYAQSLVRYFEKHHSALAARLLRCVSWVGPAAATIARALPGRRARDRGASCASRAAGSPAGQR